jgi:NMD protein affecting ribosome stability and mRNA decay
MDSECAFCGRPDGAARQVLCEDCQAEHSACITWAHELTAADAEGYRLVA